MNTPRYEFSISRIMDNLQQFQCCLPDCQIFYSVKCNAAQVVLESLYRFGTSFEISSQLEFEMLISLGIPVDKIICGLPIKPIELITYLYGNGIRYFVFDDIRELEKLRMYAKEARKILRIYISDIVPNCIAYGLKPQQIFTHMNLFEGIDGLSIHISDNVNIDYMLNALTRVEEILDKMGELKKPFILNIGGSYSLKDGLQEYYAKLQERLRNMREKYGLVIYVEPGAALVNTAGKVITKVVMVKENGGMFDVYMDAGIPIGVMRPPGYIRVLNHDNTHDKRKYYRFFDITSLHRLLFQFKLDKEIHDGDILELGNYGAYSLCYRNDFHMWKQPNIFKVE